MASADDDSSESVEEDAAGSNATPTDLAHNRAQYEPALRKHWEAKNTFDTFVEIVIEDPSRNDRAALLAEARRLVAGAP